MKKGKLLFITSFMILQGVVFFLIQAGTLHFLETEFQYYSSQEVFLLLIASLTGIVFSWWGGIFAENRGVYPLFLFAICMNVLAMFTLGAATMTALIADLNFFFVALALFFLGCSAGTSLITVSTLLIANTAKKTIGHFVMAFSFAALGMFLAPYLLAFALEFELLWLLGLLITIAFIALAFSSDMFGLSSQDFQPKTAIKGKLTASHWFFILSIFLAGALESTMTDAFYFSKGHTPLSTVSVPYAFFEGSMVIGRVLVGVWILRSTFTQVYCGLPFLVAIFTLPLFGIESTSTQLILLTIGALFQASLVPFSLAFGQQSFPQVTFRILGRLVASFWAGYFGTKMGLAILKNASHLSMHMLFMLIAVIAIILLISNLFSSYFWMRSRPQH